MKKSQISTTDAPAAIGPYSQAIRSGNFLFTSGQIPLIPESAAIPDGFEAQVKQAMVNLKAVIEAAGAEMSAVVKTTCFLTDMDDFPVFNEIYGSFFAEPFPARSCVQAARLPKGVRVEVEAIVGLD